MGAEFQCGKIKKFWRWMVVMVAQRYECAKCHRTLHLKIVKIVHFMYILLQWGKKKNPEPSS